LHSLAVLLIILFYPSEFALLYCVQDIPVFLDSVQDVIRPASVITKNYDAVIMALLFQEFTEFI